MSPTRIARVVLMAHTSPPSAQPLTRERAVLVAILLLEVPVLVYTPVKGAALLGLCLASIAASLVFLFRSSALPTGPEVASRSPIVVLVCALPAIFEAFFSLLTAAYKPSAAIVVIAGIMACAALVAIAGLVIRKVRLRYWLAALWIVWTVGLALTMHWASWNGDVFAMMQGGARSLLAGHNPFAGSYPQDQGSLVRFGASKLIFVPYIYGPSVLLLSLPGALIGDVRVMDYLFALAAVAGLASCARAPSVPRRVILLGVAASPVLFFLVQNAWQDVESIALLLWWLRLRSTHRIWAVTLLAIMIAIIPTTLVALVLGALWLPRARRELAVGAIGAIVIALPFIVLTGLGRFLYLVIGIHFFDLTTLPLRVDSLSVNGMLFFLHLPFVRGIAWVGITLLLSLPFLLRIPRSMADLLRASSGISTIALMFAGDAFVNYYAVPITLLFASLAVGETPWDEPVSLPFGPSLLAMLRRIPMNRDASA